MCQAYIRKSLHNLTHFIFTTLFLAPLHRGAAVTGPSHSAMVQQILITRKQKQNKVHNNNA